MKIIYNPLYGQHINTSYPFSKNVGVVSYTDITNIELASYLYHYFKQPNIKRLIRRRLRNENN